MHCLIFCAGTHGDCFPFLTMARHLRRRGHRVTVMAPPIYADSPVLDGIAFQPICTFREYERFLADSAMLAGRYALHFCKDHAVRWNLAAWRLIETLNASDLLVLAPDQPFFWADVAAKSQLECDAVRVAVFLPQFKNLAHIPPQLPDGRIQQHLAAALALRWHESSVEAGIPAGGCSLAGLSLARVEIPTVALWPDWLAVDTDEVRSARPFGFLLAEPDCHASAETDMPPMEGHVVFKRGLTDRWPATFYSTAIAACLALGIRGLLLEELPPSIELPPQLIRRRFVPLDRALRNARGIVHNGGIGTVAASLYCGVPQIIVPRQFDQPRNAECMRRLGVATVIRPERLSPETLCRGIDRLNGRRKRSQEVSGRAGLSADALEICEFLERRASALTS